MIEPYFMLYINNLLVTYEQKLFHYTLTYYNMIAYNMTTLMYCSIYISFIIYLLLLRNYLIIFSDLTILNCVYFVKVDIDILIDSDLIPLSKIRIGYI